jgi:hypothetical protein
MVSAKQMTPITAAQLCRARTDLAQIGCGPSVDLGWSESSAREGEHEGSAGAMGEAIAMDHVYPASLIKRHRL